MRLQNRENGPVIKASAAFLISGISLFLLAGASGQSAATSAAAQNTAKAEEVVRGKKVYGAQCEICHFSATTKKKIGPGLKGIYKHGVYANGKKVDDASLSTWIEKGGKDMPGFKDSLTASEIRDLVAYIKTF
jgi:cytochrome c